MAEDHNAVNNRLKQDYGITLAEYNEMAEKQGGGCAICGTPPKTRRLNVDHDHRYHQLTCYKPKYDPHREVWNAYMPGLIKPSIEAGSPADCRRALDRQRKRESVRGLLCHRCNRGIQFFSDDPARLEAAARYLRSFAGPVGKEVVENVV